MFDKKGDFTNEGYQDFKKVLYLFFGLITAGKLVDILDIHPMQNLSASYNSLSDSFFSNPSIEKIFFRYEFRKSLKELFPKSYKDIDDAGLLNIDSSGIRNINNLLNVMTNNIDGLDPIEKKRIWLSIVADTMGDQLLSMQMMLGDPESNIPFVTTDLSYKVLPYFLTVFGNKHGYNYYDSLYVYTSILKKQVFEIITFLDAYNKSNKKISQRQLTLAINQLGGILESDVLSSNRLLQILNMSDDEFHKKKYFRNAGFSENELKLIKNILDKSIMKFEESLKYI